MAPRAKPIIGLAGGIGSGKSTVARLLACMGCMVIDSDQLAHKALCESDSIRQLVAWWGPGVLKPDGMPDRRAIAAKTFNQPSELARLTGLIHPKVAQSRAVLMDNAQRNSAVLAVVWDSPLIFETGLNAQCNMVLFVHADDNVRSERLQKTRGWPAAEQKRRENFQIPLDKKRKMSDDYVDNNGDEKATLSQLRLKLQQYFPDVFKD